MDRVTFLPTGPWPAVVPRAQGLLLAGLLFVALTLGLIAVHPNSVPGPLAHAGPAHVAQARLAPAALGAVSEALGAIDPAYRVRPLGAGLSARNPAQRLRAGFTPGGVTLTAGSLRLGLSVHALALGGSVRRLAAVDPVARANTVSFARGGVREWYANSPQGLEQGFTVARPPGAAHARGPLTLAIAVTGNAGGRLDDRGEAVTFSHAGGASLRYGALRAVDARGRTLHSWLSLAGGELLVRVDARGARYPLSIDPLVQQGQKIAGQEGRQARFGFAVAISADGNTALVAARNSNSAGEGVWVFVRSGSSWSEQASLNVGGEVGEACTGEGECEFAGSVALSGDGNTALVGIPAAENQRGEVRVFTRSGTTWTQQPVALTAATESAHGHFGRSVALSGDGGTAVVGGPGEVSRGAAWVFTRSGASWTETVKLRNTGGERGEHFGFSVAIAADGATVLIGAPGGEHRVGAAWVFSPTGSIWTQQGVKLTGGGESGAGRFGLGVALSGDGTTALVGALADEGGAGAAWVFGRNGSSWTQLGSKLTVGQAEAHGRLGFSVALSADGHTALIGAPYDNHSYGTAWVFRATESTWTQSEKLVGAGESGRAWFGASAALSADGRTALVGGSRDHVMAGGAWTFQDNSKLPIQPPGEPPTEPPTEPPANKEAPKGSVTTTTQLPSSSVLSSTSSALGPPKLAVSANLTPISGKVLVKLPGSKVFVLLTGAIQVPFGTIIDARHGKVTLTTARAHGGTQSATFYSGMFRIAQKLNGQVIATLLGGNFKVCPTARERLHLAHASAKRSSRRHVVRKLWAEGHGSYSTKGNYATGAVLGTRWLTEDRCEGTLIRVLTDKVAVRNLVNHRHRTVRAGHSYLAKAPG